MKLNIRKFQKGGSSKLPTFSLPEINIYPIINEEVLLENKD